MNRCAYSCEQCERLVRVTLPAGTRMNAGFALHGEGLNSSWQPHVCAREAEHGQVTQAGGRDCFIEYTATFQFNYSNPSQRSESKHWCGLRREGLVRNHQCTLTKGAAA